MHNELGITREDIREWVEQTIREEVEKVIKRYINPDQFENAVQKLIKKVIQSNWGFTNKQIVEMTAEHLKKHMFFRDEDGNFHKV